MSDERPDRPIRVIAERAELLAWHELDPDVAADFNYVDPDDRYSPRFVHTSETGWLDTGDMMVAGSRYARLGWDGIETDTSFSATLIAFLGVPDRRSDPDYDPSDEGFVRVGRVYA